MTVSGVLPVSNPVEYTESLQAKSNGAFAVQLVLVYIISRLVKRLAFCEGVAQLFPSCTIAIAVGICSQLLLAVAGQEMLTMPWNDNVFMLVLLPPIVFSAGFHLKRSLFYRRMVPIVILAILGTVISLFSVATLLHFAKPYLLPSRNISYFELLAFGALISSTDPVSVLAIFERLRCDPSLGYIVMGESLLNDAVAITAFRSATFMVENQGGGDVDLPMALRAIGGFVGMFLGSILLGYSCGLMTALLFRFLKFKASEAIECMALFFCLTLIPFWTAEVVGLSGIVSILFTGIAARRFAKKNITNQAKQHIGAFFTLSANLAETSIFVMLGLSIPPCLANLSLAWVSTALAACTIARVFTVYPLLTAYNLALQCRSTLKHRPIDNQEESEVSVAGTTAVVDSFADPRQDSSVPLNHMHIIFVAGLRGAVAFGCAVMMPNTNGNKELFVETASFVILVTLIVQGAFTESCIRWCNIETGIDETQYLAIIKGVMGLRKSSSKGAAAAPTSSSSDKGVSSPLTHGKQPPDTQPRIIRKIDWEERLLYPLVLSREASLSLGLIPMSYCLSAMTSDNANNTQLGAASIPLNVDVVKARYQQHHDRSDFPHLDSSGGGGFHCAGSPEFALNLSFANTFCSAEEANENRTTSIKSMMNDKAEIDF